MNVIKFWSHSDGPSVTTRIAALSVNYHVTVPYIYNYGLNRRFPRRGGSGLIQGHVIWDLWWTERLWGMHSHQSTSVCPINFHSTNSSVFINILPIMIASLNSQLKKIIIFSRPDSFAEFSSRSLRVCRKRVSFVLWERPKILKPQHMLTRAK
jgi:hypothetical protein